MTGADRPRAKTLRRQAEDEFKQLYRQVSDLKPRVEVTKDEARNGWNSETLTAYFNDQEAAAQMKIDPKSAFRRLQRRPTRANGVWNGKYRPLRWRG